MIKYLILKTIRLYQITISPILGPHCRFYPSCSQYSYLVIEKKGVIKGIWQGLKRVLRCHPWDVGGVDLP